jgi:hypothetical protein
MDATFTLVNRAAKFNDYFWPAGRRRCELYFKWGMASFSAREVWTMRTNVSFCHPAEFVADENGDDVLSVNGAGWFADLLREIPELEVDGELCQEDWGVVVRVKRHGKHFWIGLSLWPDGESQWLAHVHHGSFAWLQSFRSSGKEELKQLVAALHRALSQDPQVSQIVWYRENEMRQVAPTEFATPCDL